MKINYPARSGMLASKLGIIASYLRKAETSSTPEYWIKKATEEATVTEEDWDRADSV